MEVKGPPMESSLLMKSLALGVRYEPQYRVRDYMGTLIDAILHAASSPFSPTVFPYSEANPIGQDLYNLETENRLKINQTDTLLEFNLGTTDLHRVSKKGVKSAVGF